MTRRIAIINYKGGTGKTTTTINLAHGLSLHGKRVLIVDIDPQGSAGYCCGVDTDLTLYDALLGVKAVKDTISSVRNHLDIIPSNERLFAAELKLAALPRRETLLARRLEEVDGHYDFVFLDCPPSMNLLNQNALTYAEEVMIPVSMEYMSLVGIRQLLKNIQMVNKLLFRELSISKIIPTFFDPRNQKTQNIMDSLQRVFPGLIAHPIRASVALSEAPGSRQTIFEYAPKSKAAADYLSLASEVLDHVKKVR